MSGAAGEDRVGVDWVSKDWVIDADAFHRQVYGCYFLQELAPQRLIDRIGADNGVAKPDRDWDGGGA